jgi:predicted Zn-dependent protease
VALALCDLALEHEDPAAAAVALREALELEPESPLVSARLEKLPEAAAAELLEAVAAAFDRRPHAASLGRWLGRRLLETRRAAEAEAVFRRLLQAAPADRDLIELWATAMVLAGRPQAAIRELEAVGQAGAHTAGTRAVLATAYAVQGRAEEAVEQYRDLLQAEPQRLEFYRPLAELLLRLGRKEEALRWVEAGIELAAGRTEQAALRQLLLQLER